MVKKNGFSTPLHPLQVIAWVLAGLEISLQASIVYPVLTESWQSIAYWVLIIGGSLGVVLLVGLTLHNPADPGVPATAWSSGKVPKLPPGVRKPIDKLTHFCTLCQVKVTPHAKHCRTCDKCIEGFDHHCLWLNNCIGTQNYRSFAIFLAVTTMLMWWLCVLNSIIAIYAFVNWTIWEDLVSSGSSLHPVFVIVVVIVCGLIGLAAAGALTHLSAFHVMLWTKKLTTYEYNLELPPGARVGAGPRAPADSEPVVPDIATSVPKPSAVDLEAFVARLGAGASHPDRASPQTSTPRAPVDDSGFTDSPLSITLRSNVDGSTPTATTTSTTITNVKDNLAGSPVAGTPLSNASLPPPAPPEPSSPTSAPTPAETSSDIIQDEEDVLNSSSNSQNAQDAPAEPNVPGALPSVPAPPTPRPPTPETPANDD